MEPIGKECLLALGQTEQAQSASSQSSRQTVQSRRAAATDFLFNRAAACFHQLLAEV